MLPRASLLILAAWFAIGLVLIGLGSLFRWLCRRPAVGADGLLLSFWLGWAILLFTLQLWHLFLPVDQRALAVIVAAAAVGLVLGGGRPWLARVRGVPRRWLTLALLATVTLWLANRALGGPRFGDVGVYHIPIVQWDKHYRIIPGLGNLYVSLGHNISYFLYVALLEVGPFVERSYHLSNSILVLLLFARGVLGFDRLVHVRKACTPEDVFYALFLPALIGEALGIFLTSPSPDQPIFFIGVVLAGELVALCGRGAARNAPDFDLLALALIAAAAVTIKLSIAGLAAGVVLLGLLRALWLDRPLRNGATSALAASAVAAMGGGLWVLGNVILTGCPLYPGELAALPVEWRVHVDALKWIQGPMTMGGPLWKVVWDWRWFLQRLNSLGWGEYTVLVPLALAPTASVVALGVRLVSWRASGPRLTFAILLPALLSFFYCFTYTPMPRYFGATLWILAVNAIVLALGTAAFGRGRWRRLIAAAGIVAGSAAMLLCNLPLVLPLHDFEPRPGSPVHLVHLSTGLDVHVPVSSQACWYAPLPCTPEPNPALRLRRPGELTSGFMIDPSAASPRDSFAPK